LKDMNEAVLFDPRNAYQNYNVAINLSNKIIYTYMGILKPNMGNINYSSAGQLSPLLKDPFYRTIGIGTRIFLGGGIGYVAWQGTQFSPGALRGENGIPKRGAGNLAVIGDLKQMSSRWLVGTSMIGYGATMTVGIGVPIPIIDEEMLVQASATDAEIFGGVVDYSEAYPNLKPDIVAEVSYAQLKSGSVTINGKEIPTGSMSSYSRAVEIAGILKDWIRAGKFLLSEPVQSLPGVDSGVGAKPLKERPIE